MYFKLMIKKLIKLFKKYPKSGNTMVILECIDHGSNYSMHFNRYSNSSLLAKILLMGKGSLIKLNSSGLQYFNITCKCKSFYIMYIET